MNRLSITAHTAPGLTFTFDTTPEDAADLVQSLTVPDSKVNFIRANEDGNVSMMTFPATDITTITIYNDPPKKEQ